ncbi:ATP-binding protein [Streptomyces sp. NPDC019396]|uniref:ATP-binding protein n=1 Tax=Streptomyces sp. NPDC019396 TaxID=3154687 RepID=UPI0033F4FF15
MRQRTERVLSGLGIASASCLGGAVLLVVSELAANAVRHAGQSPDVEVTLALSGKVLTVAVADLDPRPMALRVLPGRGLGVVAELARAHAGDGRIEPAPGGQGKSVVVRFLAVENP